MSTEITHVVRGTVENVVADSVAAMTGDTRGHAGAFMPMPVFSTGLATTATSLPRKGLGLATQLVVPPGAQAVVHLPGGEQRVYAPGSYWLLGSKPGAVLAQWVDMRRQQVAVGPIEGLSADKWRVRLWMTVDVEVADPLRIASHREPLSTLVAAVRVGALRYIEQQSHAAITGCNGTSGGLDAPAEVLLARLRDDPALEGLRIVNLRVLDRQGDERQIEAATAATVTAAQIDEELRVADARNRARLHALQAEATVSEREHALRMSATAAAARERLLTQQAEVQQATLAARLEIVLAEIRAQTSEIARDEQQWQAEQSRFQLAWERTQQQLLEVHRTDQHVRLLEVQQGALRAEGEVALAAQDRQHSHEQALAAIQQRLAEQRALQAQAIADRRAQHDRALLELHLRHEQLVSEQMHNLESWRSQQHQLTTQQQRQHDRQLAAISGAAQIAAAAASSGVAPEQSSADDVREVASAGLRALQSMAE